jgi:hypothetical protein
VTTVRDTFGWGARIGEGRFSVRLLELADAYPEFDKDRKELQDVNVHRPRIMLGFVVVVGIGPAHLGVDSHWNEFLDGDAPHVIEFPDA